MIVIPMAGLSSRFFKEGYDKPKYMLDCNGQSLFSISVRSFELLFEVEKFVFIVRDVYGTIPFVERELSMLGIKDYEVIVLDHETRGQADTVYKGISQFNSTESLTIFNIDTYRKLYDYPDFGDCDGYLEVFEGEGDNWSFIEPGLDKTVLRTTEKEPISNLCSTGLYYFSSIDVFVDAFLEEEKKPIDSLVNGELYIAPIYNNLIGTSRGNIKYHEIPRDDITFFGTPTEYLDLIESGKF